MLLIGCAEATPETVTPVANPLEEGNPPSDQALTDSEGRPIITNTEDNVETKLDIGGGTIRVNYRADGSAVGAEWPKDIPSSVPEFKYGLIDGSMSPGTGTWGIQIVNLESDAVAKYKADLINAGWTIDENDSAYADIEYIRATKDNMEVDFDLGIVGEGSGMLTILSE